MRVEQPTGARGSLRWIQQAVNEKWPSLEEPILNAVGAKNLSWLSPLASDGFAEYRDAAFVERLGLKRLAPELAAFWPRRGPQWDALGKADNDSVILVEAKAHVREFCSPSSGAGDKSRERIEASFRDVAADLGVATSVAWVDVFYQLANRIGHLWFLRKAGVNSYLALVGFVGDDDMAGPKTAEVWESVTEVAFFALGLPKKHKLTPFIIHVNPVVRNG